MDSQGFLVSLEDFLVSKAGAPTATLVDLYLEMTWPVDTPALESPLPFHAVQNVLGFTEELQTMNWLCKSANWLGKSADLK